MEMAVRTIGGMAREHSRCLSRWQRGSMNIKHPPAFLTGASVTDSQHALYSCSCETSDMHCCNNGCLLVRPPSHNAVTHAAAANDQCQSDSRTVASKQPAKVRARYVCGAVVNFAVVAGPP
jgi:hypothetical protein